MKAKSGFTLVEILIVVVILGILAAIVIPQFTSASTEAKESALVSDLQSIRSQIELYKIHHNDNLPGVANGSHIDPGGFEVAMTSKTNQDGVVDTSGGTDPAFRFGPYMQNIPNNPFSTAAVTNSVGTGAAMLAKDAVGDNTTAWWFVTSGADAGAFQANDDKVNTLDNDTPHTAY
jgi:prepilin-type N-terminal cleavage/methylation domain-containing protein